ncbi:MAG: copper-binding protein [Caulobacter sp.]|nr:copper-binding protein [Caulobacter sp.]
MKSIIAVALAALALSACGPSSDSGADKDLNSAKARARIIPPGPTGPVYAGAGTINAVDGSWVTLDHEGAAGSGLAAGRTKFRTWGDIIAASPGEPGARVAFKFQKLGDGWALVEMTGR